MNREAEKPPVDPPPQERGPAFPQHLDRLLRHFLGGLLPEEKRYWILVPLTGLAAGLFSAGLVRLLDEIQKLAWGSGSDLRTLVADAKISLRWLVPAVGGVIVAAISFALGRERGPEGTSGLIECLVLKKGRLPLWRTLVLAVTSIAAVGTGASLGREGGLIQSGAAFGSWLGEKFRLKDHHVKVLLAAGAAGGIAAAYDAPIGGSVYAMEILLGTFALDLFGPILISSVIATLITKALLGELHVYVIPGNVFRDWEIFAFIPLGLILGLVAVGFIRFFSGLRAVFGWLDRLPLAKPLIAMAALGTAAMFFPDLLGNGFGTVNLLLQENLKLPLGIIIALPFLKILFTGLCRAGGVPGGLFTPSLFVGALLGMCFGMAAKGTFPWDTSPSGAYALIGMGAILAGTMQAPITAILLVFELTHYNYSFILPLMTACISSSLMSHALQRGSLFTEPLRRKGIQLPEPLAPFWLRQPLVKELIQTGAETILPSEAFHRVVDAFLRTPIEHDRIYVVDSGGSFLGAVSLHEIKLFIRESANLEAVIAVDVMDSSFPRVYASDPISRAIEILAESDAERLPVLEGPESRKFLGTVSKRQLLAAYRKGNLARIDREEAN